MSKKTDIKTCRYANCKHPSREIDISCEDFKLVKDRQYYHSDCYKAKRNGEDKDEQTKKDLQYIKNGWVLHINNTVVYSQLFRCLNDLISRGVSSEYLVFVFDYVVANKLNLRYPAGFKFYVDSTEIKNAYQKQQLKKKGITKPSDFVVADVSDAPKFKVNTKPNGFKSILGGGRQ